MESNIYLNLEPESGAPDGWDGNAVFERDGRGRAIEIEIPDDEEVTDDAGND